MTDREKLIEVLCDGILKTGVCEYQQWHDCQQCRGADGHCANIADHLIANGVTLRKEEYELIEKQVKEKIHEYCEYPDRDSHDRAFSAALDRLYNDVTVQRWIPVTERLPEKSGPVLVHDITLGVQCFYYHDDMICSGWSGVTHWMPLPEPPEEEGNG